MLLNIFIKNRLILNITKNCRAIYINKKNKTIILFLKRFLNFKIDVHIVKYNLLLLAQLENIII